MLAHERLLRRMKHHARIIVKSSSPPVVEFDGSVRAWYVRFSKRRIARTLSEDKPGVVVTIDLDDRGEIVGVELIGVKEFTLGMLQKFAHIETPNIDFGRTRFIHASNGNVGRGLTATAGAKCRVSKFKT